MPSNECSFVAGIACSGGNRYSVAHISEWLRATIMDTVGFTSMGEGTREDYAFLGQFRGEDRTQVADNLLSFLKRLDGPTMA